MGTTSLTIFQYSQRAICVCGDTKIIKDQLHKAGGSFNPRLIHPETGNRFAGWIFAKFHNEEVKRLCLEAKNMGLISLVNTGTIENINDGNSFITDPAETDADNFCQQNNI